MPEINSVIPIIDCSKILEPLQEIEDSNDFKSFVQELGDSMSKAGFVYFVNHGIPNCKVHEALDKSNKLFELPPVVKQKYRKPDPVESFWGYTAPEDEVGNEKTKGADSKEAFDFWSSSIFNASSYPKEVPGLQKAIIDFRESFEDLAFKILRAFALYLNLEDKDFFINHHKAFFKDHSIKSQNFVRTNYYPPIDGNEEASEESLRLGEHNDWGSLTFLYQDDIGGLEAKLDDNSWAPVPPIKDSLVLNAGIMMEMWSGGTFPACIHRVKTRNHSKARQSIGVFLHPDGDTVVQGMVNEKPDWELKLYPRIKGETEYEYVQERIRCSRSSASAY